MEKNTKPKSNGGIWRLAAIVLIVVCIGLLIAVIVMATKKDGGGHSGTCGDSQDQSGKIDLSVPEKPGPFHDLTNRELKMLRTFLENHPKISAAKAEEAKLNQSVIYTMDLHPPRKSAVLKFLGGGKQPDRRARVILFRGDLEPPEVQEFICGPLPKVARCKLEKSGMRRNPVEFSLRPIGLTELEAVASSLIPKIEKEIGFILKQSYGASFLGCKPGHCLKYGLTPVASNYLKDVNKRQFWLWAAYDVEYYALHPVDLQILLNVDGSAPENFTTSNVWYNGVMFESMKDLTTEYNKSNEIKIQLSPPKRTKELFSSLHRRGEPFPKKTQRPPTLVEPDGRRYSVKHRRVDYLGWTFHFRMSPVTGPALYDVRYKEERVVYELGLAEIAVDHSAFNPMQSTANYVNSGFLIGSNSKSLVPGADCPETATFLNATFAGQKVSEPVEVARAFCLFENNNGYPLRRHLSHSSTDGGFYGGMLDSALTLRSAITILNYDYIVDFTFHQNGAIETKILNSGYMFPSFYREDESQSYGWRLREHLTGNLNHHMFHFKADVDIHGTSNRYTPVAIVPEDVEMKTEPETEYSQSKFKETRRGGKERRYHPKRTEKEALYKYNFNHPTFHVVYNEVNKTHFGEIKGYSIEMQGMSYQHLSANKGHEGAIPWARHQLAATRQKDNELGSSSPYALWDSYKPVVDFTKFIEDDENIIDEDLVFWLTLGKYHVPHSEDLPLTTTVGPTMGFFLSPYNYFEECPSMASRDQINIHYRDQRNPKDGVKVERYSASDGQCMTPNVAQAYDQLVEDEPDVVIESKKDMGLL